MAHWDGKNIVYWLDEPYPGYPGWMSIDCGCCNGIQWGGDEPRDCNQCGGAGRIARHVESGIVALYPGGPIIWRERADEREVGG